MSNALHCFDQESKLEHFLVDSDSRFQSVVVEKGSVTIYVTWIWDTMERLDLQTDIENSFPELRDLKISIVDRDDRLKESDTTRRHLERDISAEVHQLIQSGAVNGEHIDHLRLRFRMWSRLLRALGVNSQSTILKVSTDPDRTREIYEQLKPLADKHGVSLRVRGTRLDESMRDEKNIEQRLHHI